MDFDNLIWALILLSPLLGRLLRKKKQPAKPKAPARTQQVPVANEPIRSSQPPQPRAESPFDEALRQIQEALRESRREPAPEYAAEQQSISRTEQPRSQRRKPEPWEMEPTRSEPVPERSMVRKAKVHKEDETPRSPAPRWSDGEDAKHPATASKPLDEIFVDLDQAPATASDIERPKMLVHIGKGGTSFKEAFVYGQIFGRPRSRDPWQMPD